MLTQKLFNETMFMLGEIYNREITKNILTGYYMVLRSMDDEDFKSAVASIMSNRTYQSMPKPAEILEYVRPDIEAIASLALQDLETAFKTKGRVASVSFEDTTINSVVNAMGGWVYLCGMEAREWEFKRREFLPLYKTHSRRDTHIDHLPGTAEADLHADRSRYLPTVEIIDAGYKIPKVRTVPALNKPKRDISGLISHVVEEVRE